MKFLQRWPFFSALVITLVIIIFINNVFRETVLRPDFSAISNSSERKQLFFSFIDKQLQPINQWLELTRNKLINLKAQERLSYSEKKLINQLAKDYHLISDQSVTHQQLLEALLLRIDRIPPALVIAQAASESAWGTSRFAKDANNYFGIWCYTKGCGLVPNQRGDGQSHEVKVFSSASESITYYVKLLNSSKAYKEFRVIRASNRVSDLPLTAQSLLQGLSKYSERGEDYLKDLSSIIRFNKLDEKYPLNAL